MRWLGHLANVTTAMCSQAHRICGSMDRKITCSNGLHDATGQMPATVQNMQQHCHESKHAAVSSLTDSLLLAGPRSGSSAERHRCTRPCREPHLRPEDLLALGFLGTACSRAHPRRLLRLSPFERPKPLRPPGLLLTTFAIACDPATPEETLALSLPMRWILALDT